MALPVPESGPLVKASRSLAQGRSTGESSFLLLEDAGGPGDDAGQAEAPADDGVVEAEFEEVKDDK